MSINNYALTKISQMATGDNKTYVLKIRLSIQLPIPSAALFA